MDTPTLDQMNKLRDAVAKMFGVADEPADEQPSVCMKFDLFPRGNVGPVICWETGPYDWAHLAAAGGVDEEMAIAAAEFGFTPRVYQPVQAPPELFVEPVLSWVLGAWLC